jgi:two-component system, cell cycle response regulator DivK
MPRPQTNQDTPVHSEPFVPRAAFVGVMRIADDVPRPIDQAVATRDPGRKRKTKGKAAWSGPERRLAIPPIVLLVDDEQDQRDLYKQYLLFAGYRVELATGGAAALDAAISMRPDVVIMDVSMPGMDGLEATRRIKELKATRQIPVIAVSAYGETPPEWAVSAGCETFLGKPILPQDLAVEIERVIAAVKRR